jgi:hypothetical protein
MKWLPPEFDDLGRFAPTWCLESEPERYAVRLASSMEDLQDFYDAMTPRAAAAIEHCDRYALDTMPPEVLNLLHLVYSLIMVSFPVEVWSQPRVPDSGAASFDCFVEPAP